MQRKFAENVQKNNTRGAQRGEVRKSVRLRICAEIRRETPPKTMIYAYVRAFSHIFAYFAHVLHVVAQVLHVFAQMLYVFCVIVARCCANRAKTCKICRKACRFYTKACKSSEIRENHSFWRIFTPDFEDVPISIPSPFVLR